MFGLNTEQKSVEKRTASTLWILAFSGKSFLEVKRKVGLDILFWKIFGKLMKHAKINEPYYGSNTCFQPLFQKFTNLESVFSSKVFSILARWKMLSFENHFILIAVLLFAIWFRYLNK